MAMRLCISSFIKRNTKGSIHFCYVPAPRPGDFCAFCFLRALSHYRKITFSRFRFFRKIRFSRFRFFFRKIGFSRFRFFASWSSSSEKRASRR